MRCQEKTHWWRRSPVPTALWSSPWASRPPQGAATLGRCLPGLAGPPSRVGHPRAGIQAPPRAAQPRAWRAASGGGCLLGPARVASFQAGGAPTPPCPHSRAVRAPAGRAPECSLLDSVAGTSYLQIKGHGAPTDRFLGLFCGGGAGRRGRRCEARRWGPRGAREARGGRGRGPAGAAPAERGRPFPPSALEVGR